MDLDRVDPSVFNEMQKKGKEAEGILSDPHLYLCLVFMGILLVMSLFACAHTESAPPKEAPRREAGAIHK